jgi:hypothetical protein
MIMIIFSFMLFSVKEEEEEEEASENKKGT